MVWAISYIPYIIARMTVLSAWNLTYIQVSMLPNTHKILFLVFISRHLFNHSEVSACPKESMVIKQHTGNQPHILTMNITSSHNTST